jgi:hypothetical protein
MITQEIKAKTVSQTDLLDAGSILVGKSESPDVFFQKISKKPSLPEYEGRTGLDDPHGKIYSLSFEGKGATVKVKEPLLSFKKTQTELYAEAQKPSVDKIFEPAQMLKERSAAFKNSGSPSDLETNLVFSVKKSESLSFSKQPKETITGLEGLKENIDLFPEVKQNVRLDAAIKGAEKYNVPDMSKREVLDDLNAKWFIEEKPLGVSPTKTSNRDSALIQELTQGKAAEPTGISKVLNDITENRIIDTTRYATQGYTPSAFVGPSYYKQQTRQQEESEEQVISYPKNSPFAIPSMKTDRAQNTQILNTRNAKTTISPFNSTPPLDYGSIIKLPSKEKTGSALTRIYNVPSSTVNNFIIQDLYMRERSVQDQGIFTDLIPKEILRTKQTTRTTPDIITPTEPPPKIIDTAYYYFNNLENIGALEDVSKIYESPSDGDSFIVRRGIKSKKRRYPIFSARQFLDVNSFLDSKKRRKK